MEAIVVESLAATGQNFNDVEKSQLLAWSCLLGAFSALFFRASLEP